MKNIFTTLIITLLFCVTSFAQTIQERAIGLTEEMSKNINLSKREKKQLLHYNIQRLHQIDKLSALREQDPRYLNIRLDQIEEAYNAQVFNLLKNKKYIAYTEYRNSQPNNYTALMKSKYMVASTNEE